MKVFHKIFWSLANLTEDAAGKTYVFVYAKLSLKILFWHSKSYFDIRSESKNPILTFKILCRKTKIEKRKTNVKIRFSDSVRMSK